MENIEYVRPQDIEKRSFAIISKELEEKGIVLPKEQELVTKRAIHTSADFDYAKTMTYSAHAVGIAKKLIQNGADIVTDTNMALAGVNKKELARRISLLVKRRVYGDKKSVHSGPMCTGMTVNHEGKAVLSFEAGTDKLWAVDELKGFAIAGADGHFQWAEAVVVNGNQVAVWHKDIPHPVTVRYGWDDNPVHANLKNRTGLPASPFQISLEDK